MISIIIKRIVANRVACRLPRSEAEKEIRVVTRGDKAARDEALVYVRAEYFRAGADFQGRFAEVALPGQGELPANLERDLREKTKGPSPQTRALCGSRLRDVELLAAYVGTTRATIVRSVLDDWCSGRSGDPELLRELGILPSKT